MSESEPAGRLTRTPGRVDAAATNPMKASGVPKLSAKGFKTGFLDIVELKMAIAPIIQIIGKYLPSLTRYDVIFPSHLILSSIYKSGFLDRHFEISPSMQ